MNRETQDRLILPVLIPLAATIALAFVILAFSRILLAVPPEWATPISLAMALNVLTASALFASLPRLRSSFLVVVMVVGALVLGSGAVVAMAVSGELDELLGRGEAVSAEHGRDGEPGGGEPPGGEPGTEPPAGEPGGQPPAGGPPAIVASGTAFDRAELVLPPGRPVTLTFDNRDPLPHNLSIYAEEGGEALFTGEIFSGPAAQPYEIPALDPGTYYFQCDLHPPQMNGSVTVG